MAGTVMSFEQRVMAFWAKVNKEGPVPPLHPEMSNCWLWEGFTNSNSDKRYGTYCLGGHGAERRNHKAHRVAFFLWNGYWPEEDLDHLCHVTLCVRPEHMREASHKENCANKARKICKRGHPLADPNFYYYGNGKRRCLACMKSIRTA